MKHLVKLNVSLHKFRLFQLFLRFLNGTQLQTFFYFSSVTFIVAFTFFAKAVNVWKAVRTEKSILEFFC